MKYYSDLKVWPDERKLLTWIDPIYIAREWDK